jgi:hypothetical protein
LRETALARSAQDWECVARAVAPLCRRMHDGDVGERLKELAARVRELQSAFDALLVDFSALRPRRARVAERVDVRSDELASQSNDDDDNDEQDDEATARLIAALCISVNGVCETFSALEAIVAVRGTEVAPQVAPLVMILRRALRRLALSLVANHIGNNNNNNDDDDNNNNNNNTVLCASLQRSIDVCFFFFNLFAFLKKILPKKIKRCCLRKRRLCRRVSLKMKHNEQLICSVGVKKNLFFVFSKKNILFRQRRQKN